MLDPDQKRGAFFISDIALASKCEERPKAPPLTFFRKIHFLMKIPNFHSNIKRPPHVRGAKTDWNCKVWVFSFPLNKKLDPYL